MVRYWRLGAARIWLALPFVLAAGYALAAAVPIQDTEHNFAYGGAGTGTIKAQSGQGAYASEICVFCHTPHSANTSMAAPLWNKQLTSATYTLYTSDYLTSLGYPAPALGATQSSRLCLSCHDGTVALGSVYNLNGTAAAGTMQMADSGTNITFMPSGASNLGTNLADDHPVGYLYQPGSGAGQDPELNAFASLTGAVKLDPNDETTGRVECKSCHDPHDDQYKKFLRASNVDGALCKVCHNKTNYAVSGHDMSTQAYAQNGDTQGRTTVKAYSCLACHRPHTGQSAPLLQGAEEITCYNEGCHGNNNPFGTNLTQRISPNQLDIEVEMAKTKAHPTDATATIGAHKDKYGGETVAELGSSNRHAECYDCHNPHQVQPAVQKSTRGTLRISAALKGTWGVEPDSWPTPPTTMTDNKATFTAPAAYTKVSGATLTDEYQVCLKCHSNYVTLPAGARNLGQEINPYNSSYHGIVPGGTTNFFVNTQTMAQPWAGSTIVTASTTPSAESCRGNPTQANCVTFANARGRVWCSDCHGSESSTMPPSGTTKTAPYGPHGSTLNNNAPVGTSNSDRMLVATLATAANETTPLCVKCHGQGSTAGVYDTNATNSRMPMHGDMQESGPEGCFSCHMWENPAATPGGTGDIYPHGMNSRWAKFVGGTAGSGSGQMNESFNGGWYTNLDYVNKQCWTTTTAGGKTVPTGSPCNAHNPKSY